jgi:hypothetical protein
VIQLKFDAIPPIDDAILEKFDAIGSISSAETLLSEGFECDTRYDASNTLTDLEGTGIRCPKFEDYAEAVVTFYKKERLPN